MNTLTENSNQVDYSSEGLKLHLMIDKISTYASINQMMAPSQGALVFTDKYFIYLLHPKLGSKYFTMQLDHQTSKWVSQDMDGRLEPEIITKISQAISSWEMNHSLKPSSVLNIKKSSL